MSRNQRDKTLPPLPQQAGFGTNALGLDANLNMEASPHTPTREAHRPKMQIKTSIPSPSHFIPLQAPSPSPSSSASYPFSDRLKPSSLRGYTSYTNLSPSPSPSRTSQINPSGSGSPYIHERGLSSTSTITALSMKSGRSYSSSHTPPVSPSTVRTADSIRSGYTSHKSNMSTPTKAMFVPAPSPLSLPTAEDLSWNKASASPASTSAGLAKKRSSGQLLSGLGKGLGRMGSVVRRTASDGSSKMLAMSQNSDDSPASARGGSLGRMRGWGVQRPKRRQKSLAEIDEMARAQDTAIETSFTIGQDSEMELGDTGIGLPFNVEHELHVSPSLEELPPAWLASLRACGLSEQDLLLITAAKARQAESIKKSKPITTSPPQASCSESMSEPHQRPDADSTFNDGEPIFSQLASEPESIRPPPPSSTPPEDHMAPSHSPSPELAQPFSLAFTLDDGGTPLMTAEEVDEPLLLASTLNTATTTPPRAPSLLDPDWSPGHTPTSTAKAYKRLSDQLKLFSQFDLGDNEDGWANSLIGAFSSGDQRRAVGIQGVEPSLAQTRPPRISESIQEPGTAERSDADISAVTRRKGPSGATSEPGVPYPNDQTTLSRTSISQSSLLPMTPDTDTPLSCDELYRSLRSPQALRNRLGGNTHDVSPFRSTLTGRSRLPSPSKPLGPRPPRLSHSPPPSAGSVRSFDTFSPLSPRKAKTPPPVEPCSDAPRLSRSGEDDRSIESPQQPHSPQRRSFIKHSKSNSSLLDENLVTPSTSDGRETSFAQNQEASHGGDGQHATSSYGHRGTDGKARDVEDQSHLDAHPDSNRTSVSGIEAVDNLCATPSMRSSTAKDERVDGVPSTEKGQDMVTSYRPAQGPTQPVSSDFLKQLPPLPIDSESDEEALPGRRRQVDINASTTNRRSGAWLLTSDLSGHGLSSLPVSASSSAVSSPNGSPASDPLPLPLSSRGTDPKTEGDDLANERVCDQPGSVVPTIHEADSEADAPERSGSEHDERHVPDPRESTISTSSYISSESNLHASIHEATVHQAYTRFVPGFQAASYSGRPSRVPAGSSTVAGRGKGEGMEVTAPQAIDRALYLSRRSSLSISGYPMAQIEGYARAVVSSNNTAVPGPKGGHSQNSPKLLPAPVISSYDPSSEGGEEDETDTSSDAGLSALDALDEAARQIAGSRGHRTETLTSDSEVSASVGQAGHGLEFNSGLHPGALRGYSGYMIPNSPGRYEDADEGEEELSSPMKDRSRRIMGAE